MKNFYYIFFLTILVACSKSPDHEATVADYFVKNVHWGSSNNPLHAVTISWNNNSQSSKIKWGYTPNFEEGIFYGHRKNNYYNYLYEYEFPELKPSSVLYYSIYDSISGKWLYNNTFNTASDEYTENFSFSFAGDTRTRLNAWHQVSNAIENADFTILLGDLVENGSKDSLWEYWFDYGKTFLSQNLIFHSIGNHDYPNDIYLNQFVLPGNELYYSFTYGNAVFICLNSETPDDAVQYNWLLNTLEANKAKTWKFVFFHRPFFTNDSHMGEMYPYLDTWWNAFDDYGVDLIMNGHTHNYQRTIPINRSTTPLSPPNSYGDKPDEGRCQVISGGGGAPLSPPSTEWYTFISDSTDEFCIINIEGNKLTLKAKDPSGKIIDQLILQK